MRHRFFAASTFVAASAFAALAQPSLVIVGMANFDLTANGNTSVGVVYDASIEQYRVIRWTRGQGALDTGGRFTDGEVRCSDDGSSLAYGDYNHENLNNATNSITYNIAIPEMWRRTSVSHRWTSSTGPVNLGPAANGNRCDFNINTAYDISGDGRFVVGGGWTNGLCGPFRAFRYDSNTRTYGLLPITLSRPPASTPSRATRANAVNGNGRVICGYDENYDPNLSQISRHAVVWERNAADTAWITTVLDPFGGECYVASGDGTVVCGEMSETTMLSTFGTTQRSAVRWKKTGSQWVPLNMAGPSSYPTASSYDGNTIVGEQFIWKPTLNSGVAVSLSSHIQSLGGSFDGFAIGSPAGASVWGVSDDGNAIVVRGIDNRDPCLSTFTSGIFYLNGAACEPPRTILDPKSDTNVVVRPGYYSYGIILNAFASGSWPLEYSWQKLGDDGQWQFIETEDNCFSYASTDFDYKDIHGYQLRIGFLSNIWQGTYRCAISNSCGTIFTEPASVSAPFCPADFNNDGGVDGSDVEAFFGSWETGADAADVNGDGGVDGADLETFFGYWQAGGC
jgi:hypothetical protein